MNDQSPLTAIQTFDERRDIIVPGDKLATIAFCTESFIELAKTSIEDHGYFAVALSGGSTPAAIYQGLTTDPYRNAIDWGKVWLFWSDERSVPPTNPDSNYHMAMESGFGKLPIKPANVFRMPAELEPPSNAEAYEHTIKSRLFDGVFDLVMLGMGDDGHTASLFPQTHGLKIRNRWVVANWVAQHNTWRMSLTFECINQASAIYVYVLGKSKAKTITRVFNGPADPQNLPSQSLGTATHKALWVLDNDAAADLLASLKG